LAPATGAAAVPAAPGAIAPATPVTPFSLGSGAHRTNPGPDAGLDSQPAEQALLRLLQDLVLGLLFVNTQLVEGGIQRLGDGPTCRLDPFH
jgi:hypothetical protein